MPKKVDAPNVTPAVLTVNEAAAYFRISRAGIYRLIASKDLKHIHIGQRTMIRRVDADEFLRRCAGETEA